ncbi:hypothetical protein C8R43DRAFT_481828 [Mycena crocata]|nr:hypothetical protein C8R43DRAFT_481828 [Mycena crocata]
MAPSTTELKAGGNALFGVKKFVEAEAKYTEAIQAADEATDPKELAVIYSNRAACRMSLKRYTDSRHDAAQATELDPTYAKAFARLASAAHAMCDYKSSEESWQRALDALPKDDLKPAEQTQKVQYEAGLASATAGVNDLKNTTVGGKTPIIVHGEGRMPWDLAAAMIPAMKIQRPVNLHSSAWVIHGAYEDFMNGTRKMGQLTHNPVTGQMAGMLGTIVDITNGIMRDSRVIHFTDNDFNTKYNKQVMFEATSTKAWTVGGPEVVIREALARQRDQGWDAVRPALSLTIRAWIMRAVMSGGILQKHEVAVEHYKNCLDVIRSLCETWALVPKKQRGVIFEKTFMFSVQELYIEAVMHTYSSANPAPEVLETLEKESDLLIREVEQALSEPRSQEPVDPGFISSFYIYPKGKAYAMKGFVYNKRGLSSPNERGEFFRKAALMYKKSAETFPEDDEQHPWFLNIALGNMLHSRVFPLRDTLDVMKRIRLSVPKVKAIWERSSLAAEGLWGILDGVAKQEEELRGLLEKGQFTLNSCVGAEPV